MKSHTEVLPFRNAIPQLPLASPVLLPLAPASRSVSRRWDKVFGCGGLSAIRRGLLIT